MPAGKIFSGSRPGQLMGGLVRLLAAIVCLAVLAMAAAGIFLLQRQARPRAIALELDWQRRLLAMAAQADDRVREEVSDALLDLETALESRPGSEGLWNAVRLWVGRHPEARSPFVVDSLGGFRFPFPQKVDSSAYAAVPPLPAAAARPREKNPALSIAIFLGELEKPRFAGEQAAIFFAVGRCYLEMKRLEQARVYFNRVERLLEKAEGGASALRLLALQQLARIASRQGEAAEAVGRSLLLLEALAARRATGDRRWEFLAEEARAVLRGNERVAAGRGAGRREREPEPLWNRFPGRVTLPELEEPPPAPGGAAPDRALRDLVAPQDEDFAFYESQRRHPESGGKKGREPRFWSLADPPTGRRWVAAGRELSAGGMAGFRLEAAWVGRRVVAPLAAAWLAGEGAELDLETAPASGPGLSRPLLLPGWSLRLRFRPGAEPRDRARRQTRRDVAWIVALTALLLLGLVLFWRQATFEARLARSRQELVDSLSHTLKTPLARVRLLAENLQQGWVSGEEKRSEFLRAIVAESDRLDALIRRMLDLPGPEGKARAFELRSRPLAPLLEEAARRFCGRHGGTVVLSLELDRSLPPARVDAGMLAEAVDELLGNAVKYAGPGGRFALRLRRSGRRAAIEVEDDGPGIRWRDRRRLFTRYFRSDSARAAAVEGSGLGLSLVAGVARAHGGRATVRSRPGRGSCFSILIPLEEIHGRHPAG